MTKQATVLSETQTADAISERKGPARTGPFLFFCGMRQF
jgi:hypothetical protein